MTDATPAAGIPTPSLRRLPQYLRLLRAWQQEGRQAVSCTHLAEALALDPTQVRKDLALCGVPGRPKTGYDLVELADGIAQFLGWNNTTEAFLVGAGNLGAALLGYEGFARQGLSIVAAFDTDPERIGSRLAGKQVLALARLPALAKRMHIRLGVLCVPAAAAAEAVAVMLDAGITAIWNFAPVRLSVPAGVIVEDVDLAQSLAVLSHRLAATRTRPATADPPTPR